MMVCLLGEVCMMVDCLLGDIRSTLSVRITGNLLYSI